MASDLLIIFRKEVIIMSIAEYCFVSSVLTILGLLLIFCGISIIGEIISKYKFNKLDRKNREEFVDWLMKQCFVRSVNIFETIDADEFEFISKDLQLYSLSKLNDNLFETINTQQKEIFRQEKRGEEGMICHQISVKPVKYKNLKKFDVFTPYDSEILEYAESNGDIDNLLEDIDRYFKLTNDIAIYMWDGIYNKVEQESFKPNDLVLQLVDV